MALGKLRAGTLDILKKDNPTRQEMKKALDHYFFQRPSGLVLPRDYENCCGGCGIPLNRTQTEKYFGEDFCVKCVEAWKNGGTR